MTELAQPGKSTAQANGGEPDPGREVEVYSSRERKARQAAESSGRRYRFLAKAIPQIVWTRDPRRPARLVQPALGRVHRAPLEAEPLAGLETGAAPRRRPPDGSRAGVGARASGQ